MDEQDIKDVLHEIKGDVKEVRKTQITHGQDICLLKGQLKIWGWISRVTLVGALGTILAWVRTRLG